MLKPDLKRILTWLMEMATNFMPYHTKSTTNILEQEKQERLQKEEKERLDKQAELFKKCIHYQNEHNWVYDQSIIGKKGDYDD